MRTVDITPLNDEELSRLDRPWRTANYLAVGQIYLMDNPLLREELTDDHVKPRPLGHWGTTEMVDQRTRHRHWIRSHGDDLPEIRDWCWRA